MFRERGGVREYPSDEIGIDPHSRFCIPYLEDILETYSVLSQASVSTLKSPEITAYQIYAFLKNKQLP
jgi:hypothetical protein